MGNPDGKSYGYWRRAFFCWQEHELVSSISSVPSSSSSAVQAEQKGTEVSQTASAESAGPEEPSAEAPALTYMGQATMWVVTPKGRVIHIDPYAGDAYDLPADLILVAHGHFDHCAVDKVTSRSPACRVITHEEAVVNGEITPFPCPLLRWGRWKPGTIPSMMCGSAPDMSSPLPMENPSM